MGIREHIHMRPDSFDGYVRAIYAVVLLDVVTKVVCEVEGGKVRIKFMELFSSDSYPRRSWLSKLWIKISFSAPWTNEEYWDRCGSDSI